MVKTVICKHKCNAFCLLFPCLLGNKSMWSFFSLMHKYSYTNVQCMHTHTCTLTHSYTHMRPCLLIIASLPARNIRGRATAPVGAIYRSNIAEFLQISDPDLQLPLRPTSTSPNLFFTEDVRHCGIVRCCGDVSRSPFILHSQRRQCIKLQYTADTRQTHTLTHTHLLCTTTPLLPVASSPALLPLLQPLWAVLFARRQTPAWGPKDPRLFEGASPLRKPDPAGAAPPAAHTAGTGPS